MGQALSLLLRYVDFIFSLRRLRDYTKLSRVVVFITAYITSLSHDYKLIVGVKSCTSLFGGREWPQVKSVKNTFFFCSSGEFKYNIYSGSVLHENDISLVKTKNSPKHAVKFSERRNSWEKLSNLWWLKSQIYEESGVKCTWNQWPKSTRNQRPNLWEIKGQIYEESETHIYEESETHIYEKSEAKSTWNKRSKSMRNLRPNLRVIKHQIYEESKAKSLRNQRPTLRGIRVQIYGESAIIIIMLKLQKTYLLKF